MALHPNEFCLQTGLMYDSHAKTFWGTISRFPVFLQIVPRRDSMIFRLIAKMPEGCDIAAVRTMLDAWQASHTGLSAMQYQDRCMAAVVSVSAKNSDAEAAAQVTELVMLADRIGLIPCCMSCGTEHGFRPYLLDEGGVTVCDMCRPHLEQEIYNAQQESTENRPNYAGLCLGILAGAAAVFLLTFFVLHLRVLTILTGYAGVFIGLVLMQKLGKKVTTASVIICGVLCLAAGMAATTGYVAKYMLDTNREKYDLSVELTNNYSEIIPLLEELSPEERRELEEETGQKFDLVELRQRFEAANLVRHNQTFSDCLLNFKTLLSCDLYRDQIPDVIKCYLYSLLSVLAGLGVTAPRLIRNGKGIHTLRELSV